MRPYDLTKAAALAFAVAALATLAPSAFAVNSEHPLNTDHSRASTTASDPQDMHSALGRDEAATPSSSTSTSAPTGSASSLSGTTSAAESADQAIPGHAHRGYTAPSTPDK